MYGQHFLFTLLQNFKNITCENHFRSSKTLLKIKWLKLGVLSKFWEFYKFWEKFDKIPKFYNLWYIYIYILLNFISTVNNYNLSINTVHMVKTILLFFSPLDTKITWLYSGIFQFLPISSSFFHFLVEETRKKHFFPVFSTCPGRNRFLPEETQPWLSLAP